MRALVAGHWSGPGGRGGVPASAALAQVAAGFRAAAPGWEIDAVPFGPGEAFAQAVASSPARGLAPIPVGIEEASTRRAGERVLAALDAGLAPVVEGGHAIDSDAGLGLVSVLSGVDVRPTPASLDEDAARALALARARVAGADLIAAASTSRPLLGMSSVMAVGLDLEPRASQDRGLTAALGRMFRGARPLRPLLPVAGEPAGPASAAATDPSRQPGSGAAGGAAAMILALGGRLVSTGALLADVTELGARLDRADLVVVTEPLLHSPHLADALLDTVTAAAAERALPVVAIGAESSLSAHEAAQWGLHGVLTVGAGGDALVEGGRRVARTWGRT